MAKIRLLDTDYFGAATLTASSEASALPAEASQEPDRSYPWRSTQGTVTQEIDIDLGADQAITACAVANVVLLGSGVLALYERGSAGSPGAATLVTTFPAQDAERRTAVVFFASTTKRHWQLTWTNPGADHAFAELGFCALGRYTEPSVNVSVPLDMAEVDPSEVRVSVDRQRRTVTRTRYIEGRFSWQDLPDADRTAVERIFRSIGVRRPIFIVLDTTLPWTAFLGYVTSRLTQAFGELPGRYQLGFDWEEAT